MKFVWPEEGSCLGKDKYTGPEADAALKNMKRRKVRVEKYKCTHCGYWHFGKQDGVRTARLKRTEQVRKIIGGAGLK